MFNTGVYLVEDSSNGSVDIINVDIRFQGSSGVSLKESIKQEEEHSATCKKGSDSDEEITNALIKTFGIVTVMDVPENPGTFIRFEESHFINFMTKDQAEDHMTHLMNGGSDPGGQIESVPAGGFAE